MENEQKPWEQTELGTLSEKRVGLLLTQSFLYRNLEEVREEISSITYRMSELVGQRPIPPMPEPTPEERQKIEEATHLPHGKIKPMTPLTDGVLRALDQLPR